MFLLWEGCDIISQINNLFFKDVLLQAVCGKSAEMFEYICSLFQSSVFIFKNRH